MNIPVNSSGYPRATGPNPSRSLGSDLPDSNIDGIISVGGGATVGREGRAVAPGQDRPIGDRVAETRSALRVLCSYDRIPQRPGQGSVE